MITHIFIADFYHLSVPLIKGIIEHFSMREHFFILYGKHNNDVKEKYLELFKEKKMENYVFLEDKYSFFQFIKHKNQTHYIMHGSTYYIMACLVFLKRKVSWVYWGGSSSIRDNYKSRLSACIKSFVYRKFSHIVTLMTADSTTLKRDFGVDSVVIPYYTSTKEENKNLYFKFINDSIIKKTLLPIRVLIGNSAHNMNSYIISLSLLKRLNRCVDVHCMMQYPNISEERMNTFKKQCENVFGKTVTMDTQMLNSTEYREYINSFDVYVCAAESQTGLGAISTCLSLGKKVFITGKNYDWTISKKNIIYHLDDLKSISEKEFIEPLSAEEKFYNLNNQYVGLDEIKLKWIDFYNMIDC